MAYTVVHRTPLDLLGAKASGLRRLPFEEGLYDTVGSSASLESTVLETPFPFDDLVGSWNARVPPGASLEMQAQARSQGEWSPWFRLGASQGGKFRSADRQEGEWGFIDIDTLKLKRKATALRYRFVLSAAKKPSRLILAAVTVSDEAVSPERPFEDGPWVTELEVRPRSQMEEQEKFRHDICSPTSLAMTLDYWGHPLKTIEVARRVQDQNTGIFGHWPFNAAAAGDLGLASYVARLDSLADLQSEIAQGRPVVVSLTFGPGELSGSPIKKTKGHLLVVAGFTPQGDVITLDPAAPSRASVRRVYDRTQFHRAWRLNKRGLSYLIGPLKGRKMTVGVPVADLMASPRQRREVKLDDAQHLSQLLYGEVVTAQAAAGDWVKVLAEEQPDYFEGKIWQGYPGWVRADALNFMLPPPVNTVVRTRQALLHRGEEMLMLSVGTRLSRVSEDKGVSTVRLMDGGLGEIASDALSVPPSRVTEESRSQIIKTAELFLGTSYYWGGRSGVQADPSIGVDCSGLVNLAYRIHGIDLPRDSHEQKLRSRPIKSRDMKPGDLVFLSDSAGSSKITHVMIYTGGDGVIESRKSSGRVLRSSFEQRFRRPLREIESGDAVVDYSLAKPRKRTIYFGSYLAD